MQQQQHPNNEKRPNKIGKPKGMNTQKPLEKTNAWSSDQQSTQAIQALSRLGRFICFQQTGIKKVAIEQQDQNGAAVDQNNKATVEQNGQSKAKPKQKIDAPGIFLNAAQIKIPKLIVEYCQIVEKSNKNCIVFFFKSSNPDFQIIEGVPRLIDNFDNYSNYPSLKKLAPMLNQKFHKEYFTYLQFQNAQLLYDNLQQMYREQHNKTLSTAETILQCLFTKYLIRSFEDIDLISKKDFDEKLQSRYEKFYELDQTLQDYESYINELLACMQVEEDYDQQYVSD
ncbi:unnamed protein product (macronuclear) [Paramecium tetraurelia]|uniref:Uncharacterized protein n=1 Tax=Paramecium tetraurelia TaxID=5888 RepID=A0BSE4_PARTE|nr:uncharacterized protein GSPATT00031692001 [Paramecium tetraurelia]CAK61461.1 unnamed protein product [Paramecium tetraurelia]|eukprot:XP_001428859.1 hypothetical protein (macronuclear) [Paramecium tetraurelia strain d4-2]